MCCVSSRWLTDVVAVWTSGLPWLLWAFPRCPPRPCREVCSAWLLLSACVCSIPRSSGVIMMWAETWALTTCMVRPSCHLPTLLGLTMTGWVPKNIPRDLFVSHCSENKNPCRSPQPSLCRPAKTHVTPLRCHSHTSHVHTTVIYSQETQLRCEQSELLDSTVSKDWTQMIYIQQ